MPLRRGSFGVGIAHKYIPISRTMCDTYGVVCCFHINYKCMTQSTRSQLLVKISVVIKKCHVLSGIIKKNFLYLTITQ